jgi:rare lipoprotein A
MLFFFQEAIAQEFGKASYIDLAFQGSITASGEPYDGSQYTGAHKIHPFGTRLRITRQDNGRSVIIRINDRGPHIKGRIVDISYAAANSLDMITDEVVDVKIEVVSRAQEPVTTEQTRPDTYQPPVLPSRSETTDERKDKADVLTPRGGQLTPSAAVTSSSNSSGLLQTTPYRKYGLYEIKVLQANQAGFGIQVAALSNYENALRELTRIQGKQISNALLSVEQGARGQMAFKVIIGPYENSAEAARQIGRLQKALGVKGFVVDLKTIKY